MFGSSTQMAAAAAGLHSITSDWVGMRATKLTGGGGKGSRNMGCLQHKTHSITQAVICVLVGQTLWTVDSLVARAYSSNKAVQSAAYEAAGSCFTGTGSPVVRAL
jgi:hypothetical protein